VIFHVKLLVFGVRALDFLARVQAMFCDDLVSSRWGDLVSSQFLCFQPLRSRSRVIWTSKVTYIQVRGLVRSILSTNHG
jgi:hypothetical protein